MMVGPIFTKAMDVNNDGVVTSEEFAQGFLKWFESWGGKEGALTAGQLRAGIEKDLAPPAMPGGGPAAIPIP